MAINRSFIERVDTAQRYEDSVALRSVIEDAQKHLLQIEDSDERKVLHTYIMMWMGLEQLFKMDLTTAADVFEDAVECFETLKETDGLATAHTLLGKYHLDVSNYGIAVEHLKKALENNNASENPNQTATIHELFGTVHSSMSEHAKALESYNHARIILEDLDDTSAIAQVLNNIGNIHAYVANYDTALKEFYKALELYESANNDAGLYRVKGNIALLFGATDDYAKAIDLLSEVLQRAERIEDRRAAAITHVNLGYYLSRLERYSAAETHLRSGEELARNGGYVQLEATATANLVLTLILQGNYDAAQRMLDDKKELETVLPTEQFEFLKCRAMIAEYKGEIEEAEKFLTKALNLATSTEWKSYHADLHKQLRELYRDRGPLEKYVKHNEAFEQVTEEIKGLDKQRRISVSETEQQISVERRKAEKQRDLLHNTMPVHIAERMLFGETMIADSYEDVCVLFLDIVSFTNLSSRIPPGHLVHLLGSIFNACDEVIESFEMTKIKTIGDSYLAVAGLGSPEDMQSIDPGKNLIDNAKRAAEASKELMKRMSELDVNLPPNSGDASWIKDIGEVEVRMGIHCGGVIAGVIGMKRPQYDVWGDTVNVAARMESTSLPGKIQVTEDFASAATEGSHPVLDGTKVKLQKDAFSFLLRGTTEIKGKGSMKTYWLEW